MEEVTGLEQEDWDEPTVAAVLATSGVAGHWVDDEDEEDEGDDDECTGVDAAGNAARLLSAAGSRASSSMLPLSSSARLSFPVSW